jgi:hypothetical protein
MPRIEMIDGTPSMRALTESEVATIGGGTNWLYVIVDTVVTAAELSSTAGMLAGALGQWAGSKRGGKH